MITVRGKSVEDIKWALADALTCDEWDISGCFADEYAWNVYCGEMTESQAVTLLRNAAEDHEG